MLSLLRLLIAIWSIAAGLTLSWALSPEQRSVLFSKPKSNTIVPTWQWNFASSNALPGDGSVAVSSPSVGGLVLDGTTNCAGGGCLTYAAVNYLTFTAGSLPASQTTPTIPNASSLLLSCPGATGTISLSGTFTGGPYSCPTTQKFAPATAGTLTVTTTGTITAASLSPVTYEVAARPQDQVYGAIAYYGPKFDYGQGLRIWEGRTNLAPNSNNFTGTGWTSTLATVTAAAGAAPDGTSTAWSLIPGGSNPPTISYLYQTTSSAGVGTIYGKEATARYIILSRGSYASGDWAVYDLHTCNVTQNPTYGGSIASATWGNNSWCRVGLYSPQTTGFLFVTASGASTGNTTPAGTGNYVLIYGAQLEANTFPGPYIPTGSGTVNASADAVQLGSGLQAILAAPTASAIVETTTANLASYPRLLGATINAFLSAIPSGAVSSFVTTANTATFKTPVRAGIAFSGVNVSLALAGGPVATGTNFDHSGMYTPYYFGSYSGSAAMLNGYLSSAAIYNKYITGTVLSNKTLSGAPY